MRFFLSLSPSVLGKTQTAQHKTHKANKNRAPFAAQHRQSRVLGVPMQARKKACGLKGLQAGRKG